MSQQRIPTTIVDSFSDQPFKGNPAGVCLLEQPIDPQTMQLVAQELNLSETAFVVATESSDRFSIRYFSPKMEIPLCGHATLAAAKTIFEKSNLESIEFTTGLDITLPTRLKDGKVEMEFPVYDLEPATANEALVRALGIDSVLFAGFNVENKILMLEIADPDRLRKLTPDFAALKKSYDSINGVSVTARANDGFDFHSRYFWPWSGGEEDPVTGGTHTFLAKYWSEKLGKTRMHSFQSSQRTGQMEVELIGQRMLIRGAAVIVFEGHLLV